MAAEILRQALTESDKFEMQRCYGVEHLIEYDFKNRQEAYYTELLCRMFDLLKVWDAGQENRRELQKELLKIAKGLLVFSDKATEKEFHHINKENNTLFVATIYYLCGYEAIAALFLRKMTYISFETDAAKELYSLIRGKEYRGEEEHYKSIVLGAINFGRLDPIIELEHNLRERRKAFNYDSEREFIDEQLLRFALHKFLESNLLSDLTNYDPEVDWMSYVQYSAKEGILTLLQSQREALDNGLLSFTNSFSLSMPTSAGKSYITELLIYQELTRNPKSKILYLAPLRSLSRELGEKFEKIHNHFHYKVAVKYGGGSGANSTLSDDIQILVSTPEFFISLEEGIEDLLEMYKLIICDEGQLLDDYSRGINYEMLLTRLRKCEGKRFLFISAIIPNIREINEWLGGDDSQIGDSKYRPSLIRLTKAIADNGGLRLDVYDRDYRTVEYWIDRFVDNNRVSIDLSKNRGMACAAALQAVNAGPVMIYVSFKRGARGCEAFCDEILSFLNENGYVLPDFSRKKEYRRLLAQYVCYLCGYEYMLTACLENGLSYHHADIPQDIRELIEIGLNNGSIPLVVCTSTLAEGVNLPLKTIVLGNINNPLFPQNYLDTARLKNILGRVGRAGRERYGMVIFPDNAKNQPFSLIQDALRDVGIPKVKGTLFRLVAFLVRKHKLTDLNSLLGDNDLVAAIDLMITKSTNDENIDNLSIDELIKDSLAYKLGDRGQRTMLKHLFEARYSHLKEQLDANEYALLKATGFSVRELNVAHQMISDSDEEYLGEATFETWEDILGFLIHKVYQLPTVSDSIDDDSHNYVRDIIGNVDMMNRICSLWMKGMTYQEMTLNAADIWIPVDQIVVSVIFVQNCICPKVRSLVYFLKSKYQVDNEVLNAFHEMISVGVHTPTQLWLYRQGLRNRISIHAFEKFMYDQGLQELNVEGLKGFLNNYQNVLMEYMEKIGLPYLAVEKIIEWGKRE